MEGKFKYILILFFVLLSANLRAQNPSPPELPPPHHELPISGGLYYMLIIGVIYGIKVLRKKE